MTANRIVVAAVAFIALAAAFDAVRGGESTAVRQQGFHRPAALHIDLASATDEPSVAGAREHSRAVFAGVVAKSAVARDGTVALGISNITGDRPATAAVEIWRGERLMRAFRVPPGSFALGLWFTDAGPVATIGWNGRGWLWSRSGRRLQRDTYFAYETG
jgi:hypothetical protein